MNKKWSIVAASFFITFASGSVQTKENLLPKFKQKLVETFRAADEQCEALRTLVEHKGVKLEDLSMEEVEETTNKLKSYIDRLMNLQHDMGGLIDEESRLLVLAQELLHQLTNARISYTQKINTDTSVKKIAISVGAGVAVFGGLMLLNTLTSLDISVSAALLCGLATGCIVGMVTHYDSLLHSVRSISGLVQGSLSHGPAWREGLKSAAAIGVVAATTGVLYVNRGAVLDCFSLKKRAQKSLETMIQDAGLTGDRPL
ncbi:MAG: hypothetical protein QG632_106 [Candidatus Dependentiae bacterium]|nr:hypothetical protein [Candidatus Dependentiae bacterium]